MAAYRIMSFIFLVTALLGLIALIASLYVGLGFTILSIVMIVIGLYGWYVNKSRVE